jgi:hypothetical protein
MYVKETCVCVCVPGTAIGWVMESSMRRSTQSTSAQQRVSTAEPVDATPYCLVLENVVGPDEAHRMGCYNICTDV